MSSEIRLVSKADAELISYYYKTNSDHLRRWEPFREAGYHSVDSWDKRLKKREQEQSEGLAAYFITVIPMDVELIATCSLTNITRGPFQACNMGFSVSELWQGKGVMKKLGSHVIEYAFNDLNLNRIMANYMPHNHRSKALLQKLGFEREGVAKRYLKINGQWEDHVLTSLLNPRN